MAASFFRGTQLDQNVKFKDKDLELTKKMMFPADFDKPVDISKVSNRVYLSTVLLKVRIEVIRKWVERRIAELTGDEEDDVVPNFVISQLE